MGDGKFGSRRTAPFSATIASNGGGLAESGLEIAQDSTGDEHDQQPGAPRLLNGRGDIHVDRVVHGNRAVEVERENSGLHVSPFPLALLYRLGEAQTIRYLDEDR